MGKPVNDSSGVHEANARIVAKPSARANVQGCIKQAPKVNSPERVRPLANGKLGSLSNGKVSHGKREERKDDRGKDRTNNLPSKRKSDAAREDGSVNGMVRLKAPIESPMFLHQAKRHKTGSRS
jgi:hypothetical protein